ncbi:MAG: response regulator [Bacteroidales bacterium]
MQILSQIIHFFRFGIKGIVDDAQLNRIIMINVLSLVGSLLCFVFTIVSALDKDITMAVILGISLMLIVAIHLYLRKTRDTVLASWVFISLMSALMLYLAIYGAEGKTGIVWAFVYPVAAMFLLGTRNGSFMATGFLGLILLVTLGPVPEMLGYYYGFFFMLRFTGAYLTIWFLVIMFDHLRLEHYIKMEENMLNAINSSNVKDEFISKLSHQIRTPLNNIMVVSDLMNDLNLDENQKDLVETIVASTNNLVGVVNNIVRVSNIEISEKKDYNIKFDLYSTLNNTIRLFQKNENLEINLNFPGQIRQSLIGDPIKVKQIFMNLIDNIGKFHSQRKAFIDVRVWISKENDEIFTTGIELKTPLIPIRFISDSTAKTSAGQMMMDAYENEVLDFTISRKLIEQAKGRMEVTNTTQFTLFTFDLQFKKLDVVKPEPHTEKKAGGAATMKKPAVELKNSNVLLVEDNLINQKIVLLSLKKVVKNIDVANNGKEALDKFGSSKYDIVLMDIQMPIMDGILATKKIREIEIGTNAFTPIIAITANALSGDREVCLAAGMNDYIAKPFQIEVLIQKMRDLLAGS